MRTWIVVHKEYQPPLSDGAVMLTEEEARALVHVRGVDRYWAINVERSLRRALEDAQDRLRIDQLELRRLEKMVEEAGL